MASPWQHRRREEAFRKVTEERPSGGGHSRFFTTTLGKRRIGLAHRPTAVARTSVCAAMMPPLSTRWVIVAVVTVVVVLWIPRMVSKVCVGVF